MGEIYLRVKLFFMQIPSWLILKMFGWKAVNNMPPEVKKCVMIASPHTSNWDLLFTRAAFGVMKIPVRFTIKKEWIRTPLGLFLLFLGAIPIDRNPKGMKKKINMTEAMVNLFKGRKQLTVLVTPEGTRSKRERWRSGFYHVALKADVPIALGYLDYKTKTAGVGKVVYPSDDLQKDMQEIMEFYAEIAPKYPEKFSVDLRYLPSA